MSEEKLAREADRWLRQAADDLEAAQALMSAAKYAQAAFLAQQAGEKAMKAVWFRLDADPWGHSVARLVRDLPEAGTRRCFMDLLELAFALDKLYIPTRYPDALADLIPGESYTQSEARAAIDAARALWERARDVLAGLECSR